MNTGKKYKTRQKEYVLECIKEHKESYVTIQQIAAHLQEREEKVGLTTIYRNLDKLVEEKEIAKVTIEGISGTCYRYLPHEEESVFFYMKCEQCGNLVNIECPELGRMYHHLSEDHHIWINPGKTMFYGICDKCNTVTAN